MTTATKINVWHEGGEWFFAAWVDGEYDTNGSLATESLSESEAVAEARRQFGEDAEINVVERTA